MERIRILIVDLPRMLCDVIEHAIAAEPDMLVVMASAVDGDVAAAAEQANADVVVVATGSAAELRELDAILLRRPRLKVLGITRDGRDAGLRELCPRTVPIGNVGPDELANAIRRAVREEPAEC